MALISMAVVHLHYCVTFAAEETAAVDTEAILAYFQHREVLPHL